MLKSFISMTNTALDVIKNISFHSSPCNCPASSATFDVFINHRGKDTKQSVASLIYHNLDNRGVKVFLDLKSLQGGECVPRAIRDAIRRASVHVVIFSPNYAQSEWCLDELHWMVETGAPIVPVFWEIRPSEVRMEDNNGVYARAFQKHKQAGKFGARRLKKWRKALLRVSGIEGFIYEGDQGEMLEKIATCVARNGGMAWEQKSFPRPVRKVCFSFTWE